MATTSNLDALGHTIREMSEVQSRSWKALADSFASFQRRNSEFAQGGLEFLRLQESNARAVQEWWTNGVKLLQLQERNVSFAQNWLTGGVGLLRDQTEQNRSVAEVFAQSARKWQEGVQRLNE